VADARGRPAQEDRRRQDAGQARSEGRPLPARTEMLQAAETALAADELYHKAAREGGPRQDREWEPVGERLHQKLFDVQAQELEHCPRGRLERRRGPAARLAGAYRKPEHRERIAAVLAAVSGAGSTANSPTTRRKGPHQGRGDREPVPRSEAARPIIKPLRARALACSPRPRSCARKASYKEADAPLRDAQDILPRLSGLAKRRTSWTPSSRSCASASASCRSTWCRGWRPPTPNCWRASAVRGAGAGAAARAAASATTRRWPNGCPRRPAGPAVPAGAHAYWSDGEPVTAADVRATCCCSKTRSGPATTALAKLVEKATWAATASGSTCDSARAASTRCP